jgi:hypothetical protein
VAVGDFNGDGRLDLAVADTSGSTVSVLSNLGSGTFGPKTDYSTGVGPYGVAVADFDGDGHLDLAVAESADNTVSVLPGVGDGTFTTRTTFATGTNPFAVAAGALSGSGLPDLVTADTGADTVSVLRNITQAPAITSAASTTFMVGHNGAYSITSTGAPTSALSETGTLPSGLTFHDNGDGTATLSGTPAVGSGGLYHLILRAHNGVSPDATQAFTLTVDQAPAVTSAASTTFMVGHNGAYSITSTGTPTSALSETGTLPSGVAFHDNGNGTATLSGTPAARTAGVYHLTTVARNTVVMSGPVINAPTAGTAARVRTAAPVGTAPRAGTARRAGSAPRAGTAPRVRIATVTQDVTATQAFTLTVVNAPVPPTDDPGERREHGELAATGAPSPLSLAFIAGMTTLTGTALRVSARRRSRGA